MMDMDVKLERTLKMLEPAAGSETGVSPTLSWEAFPGALTYKVLVIDAGTTEPVVQQEITATRLLVSPPLQTGRTYNLAINALDGDKESLANAQMEFKVVGIAATPAPRAGWNDSLPPSCQPSVAPGTAVAVDPQRRYCYLYPARFTPAGFEDGGVGVRGPDIEGISPPLQAAMEIRVRPAPEGMGVKDYVEGMLQMLSIAPASEFRREESVMGGEPAIIVWGVSPQGFTKEVFVFHNGQCWSFMYSPSVLGHPQAADEVEELFRVTADSFTFMR
jgi:hypothetical protein